MKKSLKYITISLFSVYVSSCTLTIPLENEFSDPYAISNVETARELLASVYDLVPNYDFELSVLSDDFMPTSLIDRDAELKNLYQWADNAITNFSTSLWEEYYNVIANANVLLERLDDMTVSDDKEKDEYERIRAEALTIKASCYFDLLRLFAPSFSEGDQKDGIILKDKLDLEFLPRSSIADCVTEIRTLLSEASSFKKAPSAPGWHSSLSADYLLAELELYAGNWTAAAEAAKRVVDAYGKETMEKASYQKLWSSETCPERIFGKYLRDSYYTYIQYDAAAGDFFMLNDDLVFEEGDIRSEWTVFPFEMADNRGDVAERKLLGKYNKMNKESLQIKYIGKIRASGAYLILAEAYARSSGEQAAVQILEEYLSARGIQEKISLSGDALVKRILEEKRKEFAGEGSNYFDMKRNRPETLKRYSAYGTGSSVSIKKDDYRWTFPIPKSEYKYNDNVSQNDGWTKEVDNQN